MHHIHRLGIAVIAASALVACSKSSNTNGADSAAAMGPATTPDTTAVAATPATTDTTAAGANGGAMSDANILGKELGGDSAEVQVAKYMEANSTNAGVKSFARMLITDHTKGMSQVMSTAKSASLTPQPPANDTTSAETSHTLDQLKSLNGKDRDTAFVNHEVTDHQAAINDAQQMEQQATNPQVKALLQKTLPVLQKHLDRAQKLQSQLSGTSSK